MASLPAEGEMITGEQITKARELLGCQFSIWPAGLASAE